MAPSTNKGKRRAEDTGSFEIEALPDGSFKGRLPKRSRTLWPLLMMVMGSVGGAGGAAGYHRTFGREAVPAAMVEKLDATAAKVEAVISAQAEQQKTVHAIELDNREWQTELKGIHRELADIKEAVLRFNERRR